MKTRRNRPAVRPKARHPREVLALDELQRALGAANLGHCSVFVAQAELEYQLREHARADRG